MASIIGGTSLICSPFDEDGKVLRQIKINVPPPPGLQPDLQGNVLGMLGRSGRQLKQFGWIHEIACPSENELYVAEIIN